MRTTGKRGRQIGAAHWRGWIDTSWRERARRVGAVIGQSIRDLLTDNAPAWAAAIAYYSLLSAFPLLLAGIAVAANFVDPQQAADQLIARLGQVIPESQHGDVAGMVRRTAEASTRVGLLSFLTLLWTGSRVFGVLTKALNVAYDVDETYGFFQRLLLEGAMLLTVGLFFIFALASGPLIDLLWRISEVLPADGAVIRAVLREGLNGALLVTAFFLIYRFVPRGRRDWRASLVGAVVATALFVLARSLFVGYVQRFGNYSLIYGSLAIAILLVLWAWIVALITLFGGEIAGHVRSMLIEGLSAEDVERNHQDRTTARAAPRGPS